MQIRVLFLISAFTFVLSCRSNREHEVLLLQQAEEAVDLDPRLALSLTDSAFLSKGRGKLPDKLTVSCLLVRQRAFSKLGVMDSVLSTGVRIREIASISADSLSMAKSLLHVRGEVSMAAQRAIEPYLPGAVRAFRAAGMTYEEAVIEGMIGATGTRRGDFKEAMEHLYRARDILERMDSIRPLYAVYMNIGNNRSSMGDRRASIGFYRQAADVARKLQDSVRIASALMNEGIAYSEMTDLDSSRIRLNEALGILPTRGGDLAKLQILYNLATVSKRQGKYPAAEAEYRRLIEGAVAMGDPVAIGMANSGLASVFGKTGRAGEAIELMKGTVRLLDSVGLGHYAIDHANNLMTLYGQAGRFREAFEYSVRFKALSDSLLSADKQKAIRELEAKYNFDRQEEEKLVLKQRLKLNRLVAAGFATAAMLLLGIGFVLRQRNRLQRELLRSYERMVARYRQERDAPHSVPTPATWTISETTDMDASEASAEEDDAATPEQPGYEPTEEDKQLFESIHEYFIREKPYLNQKLRVDDVALAQGIPVRRLSQLINAISGQPFSQFVNRYRIDEATRMMEDPKTRDWKIEVIADKSGFSGRQQFRRVFEQVTGVNPGFYRNRIKS
jgi:AraC-like DNA-binding protein/tetratricopeptide (TPR) repeat protein